MHVVYLGMRDLLPARAGVIPEPRILRILTNTAPRTRGDDPVCELWPAEGIRCSPRAGMIPNACVAMTSKHPAPRARGDDPFTSYALVQVQSCSPRARG